MKAGLLSELSAIGYEIFLDGENIRLRYQKPDTPPESARLLIDELKKHKSEFLIILKMRNAISPAETPQPLLNVNTSWPPDVQFLIDWFSTLDPPPEAFYLEPHLRVIDPEKFFATLRREIETGPSGARVRMGSLQSDLRALQAKFYRKLH